jgi:hypothetical protein
MKVCKGFTEYLKECKSFEEYLKRACLDKLKEDIEKLKIDIELFNKGLPAKTFYDDEFVNGVILGTTEAIEAVRFFSKKGDKNTQQEMEYFTLNLLTDLTVYGYNVKKEVII